ncbi:MAG: hypothetical protein OXU51_25735 [Candidatus Poribacteria bacterium]|nr:hypothetical protein [Candidatus Poribacteria bacterium]
MLGTKTVSLRIAKCRETDDPLEQTQASRKYRQVDTALTWKTAYEEWREGFISCVGVGGIPLRFSATTLAHYNMGRCQKTIEGIPIFSREDLYQSPNAIAHSKC